MCLNIIILISIVTLPSFARETEHGFFKCGSSQWQCNNGYCISSKSVCNGVADCADNSDEAPFLCRKKRATSNACVLPPYPEHGTYDVQGDPNARPGQSFPSFVIIIRCRRGFGVVNLHGDGSGIERVLCVNGYWENKTQPICERFCKLLPNPSITYTCFAPGTGFTTCNNYVSPGTIVQPACKAPFYYSIEVLPNMHCASGLWDYFAECRTECGQITPSAKPLLIGGQVAKRGELPWHVGIFQKKSGTFTQICGGSLIANRVVISAAHCFWHEATGKALPESSFAVAVGKLHRSWDAVEDVDVQKSLIQEIRVASLYDGVNANYQEDIAVLILETPIKYMYFVRPVCYDFMTNFESIQLQENVLGKVAGWGLTSANGSPSDVLKTVSLPLISGGVCTRATPPAFRAYITGDKICAGYTNGTAVCMGDSGGGLAFASKEFGIDRYYLRGIVSVAPNDGDNACNAFTYTLFTRITRHQKIIQDAVMDSNRNTCPYYAFQCDNGECVFGGVDCNKRQDCADGSDESAELCEVKPNQNINSAAPPPPPSPSSECGRVAVENIKSSTLNSRFTYNRGDIPWLAAIYRPRETGLNYLCTGNLITNRHVISVAHAFTITTSTPINRMLVKLGSFNRNDLSDDIATSRQLTSVTVIESFNKNNLANDLSILTLNRKVEFSAFIRPVCLWTGDISSRNAPGIFAGWGEDNQSSGPKGVPHVLKLNIVSTATCRASNRDLLHITSGNTICAGDPNGSNPCLGDSGGGLYTLEGGIWWLRGVLSVALRPYAQDEVCNQKDYVVFTDVSKYLPWIKKVTGNV